MEKMDVDEAVVDLSISAHRSSPAVHHVLSINSNSLQTLSINSRRVLRPRTEPRSYVESPDVLINGLDKLRTNGTADYSSDSSEGEMPPLAPIKELSTSELKQRERGLRRLREELRAEEMKLVLLKKLKQSQQLKENVAVLPPNIPQSALPPTGLPSGLSITPTTVKLPSCNKTQQPQVAHSRPTHKPPPGQTNVTPLLRGPSPSPRSSLHVSPIPGSPHNRTSLSVPQPPQRTPLGRSLGFPAGIKEISPSVTITPAPPQPAKERPREEPQTPAQRQAAAKLALRKQLEKTLLQQSHNQHNNFVGSGLEKGLPDYMQIPPPKPPPPEMHFIPNPSNTEFIYLVGLEHVVDFLTKETKTPIPPQPFSCSQCQCDFTPVWKWEMRNSKGGRGKDSKVICEQCVTTNVKKALKAEHTNRLKTAFVKALQQEQEIEQRLAQNGVFTSSSPAPSPVTPEAVPKSITPTPTPRHAATPPAPPPPQQTPPPPPPRTSHTAVQDKFTMQAFQQQILRTLQAGNSQAHMLTFSPLLYSYHLAMAQAAAGKGVAPNMAEMQRAAELQRQYLLDMIPPQANQRHNWKT